VRTMSTWYFPDESVTAEYDVAGFPVSSNITVAFRTTAVDVDTVPLTVTVWPEARIPRNAWLKTKTKAIMGGHS